MGKAKFGVEYVYLDEEGFRARLQEERRKLENLVKAQRAIGYDDEAVITLGRVSGMSLALSYMEEYVVRPKER